MPEAKAIFPRNHNGTVLLYVMNGNDIIGESSKGEVDFEGANFHFALYRSLRGTYGLFRFFLYQHCWILFDALESEDKHGQYDEYFRELSGRTSGNSKFVLFAFRSTGNCSLCVAHHLLFETMKTCI